MFRGLFSGVGEIGDLRGGVFFFCNCGIDVVEGVLKGGRSRDGRL